MVKVVLFSGGRGSRVLSRQLINHPQVKLTLAINGYDDGASTGEVRRFLGDSLGPSDFRKNASRMAHELKTCQQELIDLLDIRLPVGCSADEGLAALKLLSGQTTTTTTAWQNELLAKQARLNESARRLLADRLRRFERELLEGKRQFSFSDCAVGNIVFAGCFLETGRSFNAAITDYCALLGVPDGLIENVTDGENACLVALNLESQLLATEAEIVSANRRNHIKDIYLFDRILTSEEERWASQADSKELGEFIRRRTRVPAINPRLLDRIAEADLIIYSPGTQHSSLFPSYLTPGLGEAIARNLKAMKLLITNLQEDAEIPDSSAVDIIERAVYYLKDRNTKPIPTPCLITHYLLNDHLQAEDERPYVPLGRLESLEDPRLVRIGNYEEGRTGTHDAAKILLPFINGILHHGVRQRVAVWLLETDSLNKITQTMLEALRGGLDSLPLSVSMFYSSSESLDPAFTDLLPFPICNVKAAGTTQTEAFRQAIAGQHFDYVLLFDSSGMYRGEEIVNLAALLTNPRLDAVWGSRRLSVKDIHESYKLRYRNNVVLGAISYIGSHLLSLAYLMRYGRYLSDTLSAARAIRTSYLRDENLDLRDSGFNQKLLCLLLENQAEVIETPIQFFPLSPDQVRRTTVVDGLRSLLTVLAKSRQRHKAESPDLVVAGQLKGEWKR
ncbi:MAG TPA: 2-phospho-L-lactate transferase CofD family protein [Blastocatellia bacterium]|nr:2-phospho-L-lactate transferase CofD family protein [Blastocatellia bacterium]